jgi:hypothetical protein
MASMNASRSSPKKGRTQNSSSSNSRSPISSSSRAVAPKKLNQGKSVNSKQASSTRASSKSDCSPSASGVRRSHLAHNHATSSKHTKIVVKCNCGFSNNLYLRGEGVKGLSWDKGTLMKCTKADEWVWETDTPFNHAQIKVLINDKEYELGENHDVDCGKSVSYAPRFLNNK